jgi:hypothetical protein
VPASPIIASWQGRNSQTKRAHSRYEEGFDDEEAQIAEERADLQHEEGPDDEEAAEGEADCELLGGDHHEGQEDGEGHGEEEDAGGHGDAKVHDRSAHMREINSKYSLSCTFNRIEESSVLIASASSFLMARNLTRWFKTASADAVPVFLVRQGRRGSMKQHG